jgi:hypothetical protein
MAQVGIGTTTPNANAALDVVSTSQGMLFPRMTTAQRNAIVSPAKGLTIFNTTLNSIQTNIGTSSAANWKNWAALIDPSTNGTAIVSAYTCSTASAGTMTAGVAVSGVTQTITATVTKVGTYSISITANGVTFAGSGTFAGTGAQNIVLTATGTPTAAGSNSFTLNTTPNCSFSRITLAPLPGNITLSAIGPYFIASVYDQDYLPYTAPTSAASLATAQAADGTNETFILDIQGNLTTTGVTIQIPYTVVTATVSLPAFTQTINVPASLTQDGIARDVTFSYAAASLGVGSGRITANLKAVVGTLNAKKLDLQTGIGNDNLGWLLAQFTYATNNSGGTANFQFRNIAPIPDRNIADVNHRMFYVPVSGLDGRMWLNNNLGADYANTTKTGIFNPAVQAGSSSDLNAYGSFFQWGRYSDGHELINWFSWMPSAGATVNRSFITANSEPFDWVTPQNNNLWLGASGTNNPCPIGFRLPIETELINQRLSWSSNNSAGALASPLKLPLAGVCNRSNGVVSELGVTGYYWSSSISSTYSRFFILSSGTNTLDGFRANGYSVRCIAAGHPSTDGTAVVSGYTCSTASAGTMTAGVAVSGVTQTITATVTTVGTYSISTTTANGVTFAASGTFAGTGAQTIVLTATGTPTAIGSNSFTLNTSPNCSFSRTTIANSSSNGTAVVSTNTCSTASTGTMIAGVAVSGVTQTITATVTTVGTYNISTTANGVTFAASGTFAGTGAQNIVLTATGTPTAVGNWPPFQIWGCSFSRITIAPLPANITLSAITPYFVASVYDQDYLPYTAPTAAASLATAQAANGTNETFTLDIQGSLTTTGVTLKIPYTVVTAAVSLPAFSQTINVPASFTQDNIARNVTFSYAAATLGVGSGTINATLQASGGTLNAKKLDLQTGIGNDNLGWLLAQFTYATNNNGGSANFQFRNIAPIPDRNIADADHRMFYLPVSGADGKTWLNNNLGANYANTTKTAFNPAAQASSSTDQNAYGSLFQWGRGADGHELMNWSSGSAGTAVNAATSGTSSSTTPGNSFLSGSSNWYTGSNPDNLWQGVSGTNNPCPIGYRLPADTELENQRLTWSVNTSSGAIASTLKLPSAGRRFENTTSFLDVGTNGNFWSNTFSSNNSRFLSVNSGGASVSTDNRANGYSVRCIEYDGAAAIVSAYTCNTASTGTMTVGTAVSGVTQTITATVTAVGSYNISTTANGVTFAASGIFADIGAQNIVLTATGTPSQFGSHSFTLNTTPNCSFSRPTRLAPLHPNITLSAISHYFIASVFDQDYLPYTAPTVAASLATAQAANGVNEATAFNIQGSLTSVALKIPYTVAGGGITLPAFSQTINVPASFTEDGIARDVTFSYGQNSLSNGSGTINAILQAVGGPLNAKKLDIQTGIGNDALGWLLAQFTYATNSSDGVANFQLRNIAAIPDRNIADANHVMFYLPVRGFDEKTWLNNNLGANYANTTKTAYNPAAQASSSTDQNAYGSLFQWGRGADGHELINWSSSSAFSSVNAATSGTSTSTTPGSSFLITTADNWYTGSNPTALWQGESGTNNPCPVGYRLPTSVELTNQRASWTIPANRETAFASPLKLNFAPYRTKSGAVGPAPSAGDGGFYWSSTVNTTVSQYLKLGSSVGMDIRANGFSVRCIANDNPSTNGTAIVSSYTCSTASAGTMTAGVAVSGVTQTITATVTAVGTYSIFTIANGITFTASGTFLNTGAQNIVLTATGTPTAAGSNPFTLNTTPNCSFSRTTLAPLPANITLSAIGAYFVASVNDQDYLPYTAPTVAASLATAQAADGTNETFTLNVQGALTTTGVTIQIPYTVVTATVILPAFTQTINVPASFTQDGIARDVTFSYATATLAVGSGRINATLQSVGGTLNAKKLDIQTGIGNDNLGWLLAQFTYATNNSGGTANFQFRNIAPIPDRNIADVNHRMFYVPVAGLDGKTWLNNNLGANYANTTNGAFNPAAQAGSSTDQNAYGSLFQWGRYSDGHEFTTSGNTAGPIATPWTSSNFITNNTYPVDWRNPQDGNLWQGVSGTNNPCPIGYRLPTETELNNQRLTWSSNTSGGAIASPLKLPMAGFRNSAGSLVTVGTNGLYWSTTVSSIDARNLFFYSSDAFMNTSNRAFGGSVRCLKN